MTTVTPGDTRTGQRPARIVLIRAVLELRTPGGVASPEQRHAPEGVDLPLARSPLGSRLGDDGTDGLYLPASSLAGSLRAHLRAAAPEAFADLMGSEPDEGRRQPSAKLTPSALRFCGTRVEAAGSDERLRTVQRVRTAIDRDRAAAAVSTLRVGEFLLPGSRIVAFLRLDRAELAGALLDALASWAPVVGRGRTSGHGRTALVELSHRTIDLDTPAGRRVWLTGGGPDLFTDTEPAPVGEPAEPEPLLRLDWQIVDGLHIGTGGTGGRERTGETGPQIALLARDHRNRPYVPGSTWKGVLRSRCEFILRSLGAPACAPTDPACGACLVCVGFGFTGPGQDAPSRRGLLLFEDSAVDGGEVVRQAHAPQDRVFGGVRDGLLFTEEVVRDGRLTLAVRAADPGPVPEPLVALLRLACHDLHHGLVGVGGSVTRGLGTLRRAGDPAELAAERAAAVATLAGHLAAEPGPSRVEER